MLRATRLTAADMVTTIVVLVMLLGGHPSPVNGQPGQWSVLVYIRSAAAQRPRYECTLALTTDLADR